MKKSIFYKMLYVCIVALLLSGAVSAFILQNNYEQNRVKELEMLITASSQASDSTDAAYLSSILGGDRITIIDLKGDVISDSSVQEPLENHKLRPEVISAMNGEVGVSKRISATVDAEMLYVAVNRNNLIYRIAVPISGLDTSFLKQLPAILTGVVVSGIVAVFLVSNIVNSAVKPLTDINSSLSHINDKDYDDVKLPPCKYEEINSITRVINEVVSELSGYIEDISRQNDKMDFILNNMAQGLVLTDSDSNIIHCNRFASLLFESIEAPIGKPLVYLTRENKIVESAEKAISTGASVMFDINREDFVYCILIKPVHASWQRDGALIMITDVTQERSRQHMRQQFVGNVSHDLKTPITSIGGFAELLSSGLVTSEEKQQEYLERILDQSQYMERVINDLLELSALDETTEIENPPTINAYDACCEVRDSLLPMADDLKLNLEVKGSKTTTVKMEPDHFKKVINELMTNAIKYNKENGSVSVELATRGDKTQIKVSDTGCGINPLHIPRLFERFYREDESRNSRIPGTGLGLSIIKHIVSIYGGSISVSSTPDSSTVFKIIV